MRYIPITSRRVEELRKQAKREKQKAGGKHADLLDKIARRAGYEHWHHVTLCANQTERDSLAVTLTEEVRMTQAAEAAGQVTVVLTGSEKALSTRFIFFSTGVGDAWMLDPAGMRAMCLTWRGERQPADIHDLPRHIEIMWDGEFEIREAFFIITTDNPGIGSRAIAGYPVDKLRETLESLKPIEVIADEVFGQDETVELTEDVLRRLEAAGWPRATLDRAVAGSARYSPARDSMLFPAQDESG